MAVSGADPDQLRATARQFQEAADRLQIAVRSLTAITGNAAIWRGADADRFRSEWNSQSVRALNSAIQALQQGADALRHNAEEQHSASRADGPTNSAPGAGASTAGANQGSAAQTATDLWKEVRDVPRDGYRVQEVRGDDGTTRYIVYIGGTTGELAAEGQSKLATIPAARGQLDENQIAKLKGLIPKDAEVMLVGYSQGGMDAQNIAKSGQLNVKQIVTFGSPSRDDLGVPALHLRETHDVVPGSTSIAFRVGLLSALVANRVPFVGSLISTELTRALIDSYPYSWSDMQTGQSNEFFKADSCSNDPHGGYDVVSAEFDKALREGSGGTKFERVASFRGEVVDNGR